MHLSLIAKQTGLHVQQIVSLTLLEAFHITLELELLCFQVVARIVLLGDGKRSNVK